MKAIRPDEFEVSLFGPGYGESALIHLGANEWVVVDSCSNNQSGVTAPLDYLRRIGVDPARAVRVIVATHWHDDHVRGLSNVVRSCVDAHFVCASALTEREFVTMVTRYEAGSATPVGSGVREMYQVRLHLKETRRQTLFAAQNRLIFRSTAASHVAGGACEITTLSPSDKQVEMFWGDIARQMPGGSPNDAACSGKSTESSSGRTLDFRRGRRHTSGIRFRGEQGH